MVDTFINILVFIYEPQLYKTLNSIRDIKIFILITKKAYCNNRWRIILTKNQEY